MSGNFSAIIIHGGQIKWLRKLVISVYGTNHFLIGGMRMGPVISCSEIFFSRNQRLINLSFMIQHLGLRQNLEIIAQSTVVITDVLGI